MMTGLGHDLRYALRQVRRNPGFAAAASLTLALGIAATTTVFSFVDAALLRPLPYPEPSRLFVLWNERGDKQRETLSYPNYLDYRDGGTEFESVAIYRRRRFNVATSGGAERVQGAFASANFFRTLGLAPSVGRDFLDGEDRKGGDAVALVSDGYWRRQLGADPAAVGRTLRVDGEALTLIGVVPAGRGYPADADVWIPISHEAKWLLESRGLQGYTVIGRLAAGGSPGRAQQQMATLAERLEAEYPRHNEGWTIRMEPLQHALAGDLRPTLLLLFGSAAILLLITAVNLANMLLARAGTRHRELAVRRAIGASDRRLIRQLLTENLVLSAIGGALGVLGAMWGVRIWLAAWEDRSGSPSVAAIDWRVLLFALAATVSTALLFGLAPAVRVTRTSLGQMLRSGTATARSRRVGRFLVAGEIGLALILAVGGGLLVRSLLRLQAVDPGFGASGVLTARVSLPEANYKEPKEIVAFYQRLIREVSALPGVQAAGAADAVPMTPGGGSYGFAIQGRPAPAVQEWPIADLVTATPGYFEALRLRRVRGRLLEERDNHEVPDVALVNETMARTFWPGQDPVGAKVTFESDMKHWVEVVGVVGDVRTQNLGAPPTPQVYIAHAQWGYPALVLTVRTAADPLQLITPIRAVVRRMDPEIPISEARTLEQALGASLVSARLRTAVFSGFAGLALVLAGIGIYGVMAYLVAQREREIAVRIALGARRGDVLGGVIGHSMRLAAPGLLIGLVGALISARVMRTFLYEVEPTDPLIIGLVCSGVAALVVAAALVPARRAAGTDPMTVLRSE
jgi:putative ABC transport system permease protein